MLPFATCVPPPLGTTVRDRAQAAAATPLHTPENDPEVRRIALERRTERERAAHDEAKELGISDDQLASQFTFEYASRLRFVASWGRWLRWDGRRWADDEKRTVFDEARAVCRKALREYLSTPAVTDSQRKAAQQRLGAAPTVFNVVKLASTDPRHAVAVSELDAHAWLLNTPAGVVDLRTGVVSAHDRDQLHTKCTAAAPGGECPTWLAHLERVIPETEARAYLQRLFGSALVGAVVDHVLPFLYGGGRNGKGVTVHTLRAVLGDYGLEIPSETLMESHHDRHPTELAVLRGARLVVASEVDTGRRWNESRLKRLTGGDPISARYIAKDLFEFMPSHTLIVVGNSKPGLRQVDEAIRGRIHLVNFGVTIPEAERDPHLPERLRSEYGGILRWLIEGCLQWQRDGLAAPASVRLATDGYLDAEDSIATWMAECCEKGGQLSLKAAHASYRTWCDENAAVPLGRNTFADQLKSRGIRYDTTQRGGVFPGLQLRTVSRDYEWTAS